MKTIKIIVILLLISHFSFCQGLFSWFKAVPADCVQTLFYRQDRSMKFYEFTKEIAEPSTISFKTLDFDKDLGFGLNKKGVLLNADIQTPITLGGKRWYFNNKKGAWFSAIHIIPQFKVKIFDNDSNFNDLSNPVRTPSYIPRITYYGSFGFWQNPKRSPMRKSSIMFSVFHHSNGQDGPEFFQKDSTFSFWKKGLINTYNGNFGENIVFEFGFITRKEFKTFSINNSVFNLYKRQEKRLIEGKNLTRKVFSSSEKGVFQLYSKYLYEIHPDSSTNSKFLKDNLYGKNRLNLKFGLSFLTFPVDFLIVNRNQKNVIDATSSEMNPAKKEQLRIILDASFILDKSLNILENNNNTVEPYLQKATLKNRININLSSYLRIPNTTNSAIFIQGGYNGSEPYNIYFQQRMIFIRAGLALLNFNYP